MEKEKKCLKRFLYVENVINIVIVNILLYLLYNLILILNESIDYLC